MRLSFLQFIPITHQPNILIKRLLPTRWPHKIIMIRRLRSHIILRIPIIQAVSNLFFNFSCERRVPPADELPVQFLLFVFDPEILVSHGFFFWDRGIDVILVQELFLVFLHELGCSVAFEFTDVVAVWLSEASDFLVAFLGAWWNVSIRFYGEIIPWKLSFRIQPQRKIILCCILRTLHHFFNLLCFYTLALRLTKVHLVLNSFGQESLNFLIFFRFFIFLTARTFLFEDVVRQIITLCYWWLFTFLFRCEASIELDAKGFPFFGPILLTSFWSFIQLTFFRLGWRKFWDTFLWVAYNSVTIS